MTLASTLRFRSALVLVVLVLAAPRVGAEPITHQFTGQLTMMTDGSGLFLDLTGVFSLGQPVTLDYTIETDTPSVPEDAYTAGYTDAITALSFSIGSWTGSGTPGYSLTTVTDNAPSPAPGGAPYDQYSAQMQGGLAAPPLGTIMFQTLTYTFDDVQGTVFGSTALPRQFPDLSAWEGKTLTFLFFDFAQLKSGHAMATLSGVTTPAQVTTWGGLKALYR